MAPKRAVRVLARKPKSQPRAALLPQRVLQRGVPGSSQGLGRRTERTLKPQGPRLRRLLEERRVGVQMDLEEAATGFAGQDLDVEHEEESSDENAPKLTTLDRRGLQRQAKFFGQDIFGAGGEQSLLERKAVTDAVRRQYSLALRRHLADHVELAKQTDDSLDKAVVKAMNTLHLAGEEVSAGEKLFAATTDKHPSFGRHGPRKLPRALRCLKGWRKMAPPRSRVPKGFPVVAAVACELCRRGHRQKGLWILTGHGAYLRPAENMGLRRCDLIRPSSAISAYWSIIVCPEELRKTTKTGSMDDSVVWDAPDLLWMGQAFDALKKGEATAPLWGFDYGSLTREVRAAAEALKISFVPYHVRHSGPSWDRLQQYRTLESIQKRGRWRSFLSVQRYEKSGRISADYQKYSARQKAHFEDCQRHLRDYVLGLREVPEMLVV